VIDFGPVVAKGNAVTVPPTAAVITAFDHATTGIMLRKVGGSQTIRHQEVTPSTYDGHAFFKVTIDATDTDTPGSLFVVHSDPTTYLNVWRVFMVIPQQVWDSLFGTDKLDVNVAEQANIDFGALQKASLNAATPASIQNIPATGAGFTALGDARIAAIVAAVAHTGASAYPATADPFLDPDGAPVEGISIECYSDSSRTVIVDIQETDVNGLFSFHLSPGTYYFRALKVGYTIPDWSAVIT
jgi:hypothetical protein